MPDATSGRQSRSSVEAVFADLRQAREAIDELEAKGINAGEITLQGESVERAAEQRDTTQRDVRVSRHIGARAGLGLTLGGAAGGVVALIVALAMGMSWVAVASATLAGIVGGAAIGLMVAGVSSIDATPDWEPTFDSPPRPVVVEVATGDPSEAAVADDVLSHRKPKNIRHST